MILLALVAAALAWLHFTGRLTARMTNRVVAGAVALLALRFGLMGRPLAGVALAAVAVVLYVVTDRADRRLRGDEARARALLGLDANATPEDIRIAHRRLASAAHPDTGGSHAGMQALNAARDLLLKRAKPRPKP